MFVGRKKELALLDKFYKRNNFELFLLYGRRRVGKTELLTQFIKDKNALFFVAEETTSLLNLKKLSSIYSEFIDVPSVLFQTWEEFFISIVKLAQKERIILIIDEFPYLSEHDSSFLSKFQYIVDHMLRDENIMIVLCGSSISFMERALSEKSPIFGRITGQLFLKPFKYYDAMKMVPNLEASDRLRAYFILGGIPEYLRFFNQSKSLNALITTYLLDSSESLFNTPNNLLKQELRNPSVYNAILESASSGATKPNEIMTKIGVAPAVGQKYLQTLMDLHLLEKISPVANQNRRKSIYRVSDHLFEFIYRFAYKYRSQIEAGNGGLIYNKYVEPRLQTYFGTKFEVICLEYIEVLNSKGMLPDFYLEIGKWWGGNKVSKTETEIDILCVNDESGLYGECKFRNEALGMAILDNLQNKSLLIPKKHMHYFLFSKSGFTDELKAYSKTVNNISLVDLDMLLTLDA